MWMASGLIALGLLTLFVGGELLVRGASRLAAIAGISPLVIGLTVVAFGTSAPELAVSLKASWAGQTDIAVGNVVGSNIFNVLFVLGASALVAPLLVSSQLIRIDVPLMIAASVLMWLLGLDGRIGRVDGAMLFAGLLAYIFWSIYQSRRETKAVQQEFAEHYEAPPRKLREFVVQIFFIVAGLLLLTFGAHWLVEGAVVIARLWGMSELLIGLTIVSIGTSLPEAAASIVASLKNERDIAVGNVVGSSIFNIMCVLALSSVISSEGMTVSPTAMAIDIPVMIAVAVACLPIFFTGYRIDRWEGGLFFAYYWAYTLYLILVQTRETLSEAWGFVVLAFILPLTIITLLIAAVRSRKATAEAV
ncbi:MAG: calcium/sodium antiporter [Planctomycetales bacterium]|nr:calcium/sodium antiporter [Planctomycetales bacterium]